MDVLDLYKKNQSAPNAVGDASKGTTNYREKIANQGSALIGQVKSPTKASTLTTTNPGNYEEQIFEEGV